MQSTINPMDHERLAHSYVRRQMGVRPNSSDYDDFVQQAMLAIVRAARPENFDPTRGRKFSTYAYAAMRNELATYGRKRRAELPTFSLQRHCQGEREPVAEDRDDTRTADLRELWRRAEALATPRELEFMRLYYADGLLMPEIARRCGCSMSRVSAVLLDLTRKIENAGLIGRWSVYSP